MKTSASQLKAKLGKYMRAVRAGHDVIVTDRDEPVARLVPFRAADVSARPLRRSRHRDPAAPPLGQVVVAGIRYRGKSTTELLRQDRDRR